jgi:hypothetical protein
MIDRFFYYIQVEKEKKHITVLDGHPEIAILIKYLNYEFGKFL